MIRNDDLDQLLFRYGREMSQDFVSRSDNINDVIQYLRAECEFEILKLTSFVTNNLIQFEKKAMLSGVPRQVPVEDNYQDIYDFDNPG